MNQGVRGLPGFAPGRRVTLAEALESVRRAAAGLPPSGLLAQAAARGGGSGSRRRPGVADGAAELLSDPLAALLVAEARSRSAGTSGASGVARGGDFAAESPAAFAARGVDPNVAGLPLGADRAGDAGSRTAEASTGGGQPRLLVDGRGQRGHLPVGSGLPAPTESSDAAAMPSASVGQVAAATAGREPESVGLVVGSVPVPLITSQAAAADPDPPDVRAPEPVPAYRPVADSAPFPGYSPVAGLLAALAGLISPTGAGRMNAAPLSAAVRAALDARGERGPGQWMVRGGGARGT